MKRFTDNEIKILKYCKDNTEYMWAAMIVGLLLECDFKESTKRLEE